MSSFITAYFKPKQSNKRHADTMLLADDGKEEYTTPRPKKSMKLTEEGPEEQGSADANHDSGSTSTGESCADAEMSDSQRKKIEERKKAAKAKQEAKKRGLNPFNNLESLVPEAWKDPLKNEFRKGYFQTLQEKLIQEHNRGKRIFPPARQIFRAFEICPLDKIKVVIIGQDPYHNVGQAEGLCFSVPRGIAIPSSLRNIYKELKADIKGFRIPKHGNLLKWAQQGVFLLNTGLTVRAHEANSHKKHGWQDFTAAVVSILNQKKGLVFLLWGGHAQKKAAKLTVNRHLILKSAHPSGLSAHRGFFGSRPFSKVNEYLKKNGQDPINWQV